MSDDVWAILHWWYDISDVLYSEWWPRQTANTFQDRVEKRNSLWASHLWAHDEKKCKNSLSFYTVVTIFVDAYVHTYTRQNARTYLCCRQFQQIRYHADRIEKEGTRRSFVTVATTLEDWRGRKRGRGSGGRRRLGRKGGCYVALKCGLLFS